VKSVRHFPEAIKLYRRLPTAYRMLATPTLKTAVAEAEAALRKSIELQPICPAYLDLGRIA